jgi:LPS O-antigen subunit length determinant protein (WzzB/FepE family)
MGELLAIQGFDRCEYAQNRHKNLAMWRNLWTILLFALGAAIIGFAAVSILFFSREDWAAGAATTVATIVQGAGVKWVVTRRQQAKDEEEKAYQDVGKACKDTAEADGVRRSYRILNVR